MDTSPVFLFEFSAGRRIAATLHHSLVAGVVRQVETEWQPLRTAPRAEHSHWDWHHKAGFLVDPTFRCAGVECGGRMQGMMLMRESGYAARLPPDTGLPVMYIDYLEAAPWNLGRGARLYGGVGQLLVREAVRRSTELGFGGRVGLHSLRSVEDFYSRSCGFVGCGRDPGYHGLAYFEFTSAQAAAFTEV